MQRILAIDLDDTLIDHTAAKIDLAGAQGLFMNKEQTTTESLRRRLPPEEFKTFHYQLYMERGLHSPMASGALESIQQLRRDGWDFRIIAHRLPEAQVPARQWVESEMMGVVRDRQIVFVTEEDQKDTAAAIYGASVYLDDEINSLKTLTSVESKILYNPFEITLDTLTEERLLEMRHWNTLPDILMRLYGGRADF